VENPDQREHRKNEQDQEDQKRTFAIVAAMPWMRVKPSAPAIKAMMAKMMAHLSTAPSRVQHRKGCWQRKFAVMTSA
jgi:hypothetical protein